MFSRHDGSGFGRRLRRTVLAFAVPLVLAALAVGHYRACAAACRIARPNLADADAQKIVDFMKASVRTSARYFWGTAALGAVLLLVALRMARRQAELGDEMEGLVRNTLHRLSHSLSAIREEAGGIRSGRMEAASTASAIESLSVKEAEMISAYMLLVKGFAGFDDSNAEPVNLSAVACRVVADAKVHDGKDVDIRCSVPEKDIFVRAHPYLVGEVVGNRERGALRPADRLRHGARHTSCGAEVRLPQVLPCVERRRQGRLWARSRDGARDCRVSLRRQGLAKLHARHGLDVHSHLSAQLLKRFRLGVCARFDSGVFA